jgi:hypothetical protein
MADADLPGDPTMIIGNRKAGWLFDPEDDEKPQAITESNPPLEYLRQLGPLKPILRRVPLQAPEPAPPEAPKADGAGDDAPKQP